MRIRERDEDDGGRGDEDEDDDDGGGADERKQRELAAARSPSSVPCVGESERWSRTERNAIETELKSTVMCVSVMLFVMPGTRPPSPGPKTRFSPP